MTTVSFSYPGSIVFYAVESSERDPDLVVAALQHALVTVHKVTRVIRVLAGQPEEYGYVEGVGRAARFQSIYGIAQLENEYILSDADNKCLRSVDYLSDETQTFAGLCRSYSNVADGSFVSARFLGPGGMTRDLVNPTVIYLVDDNALRKIDLSAETVITLPGSRLSSRYRNGIAMSPAGGLLVTSQNGIIEFNVNEILRWLTGGATSGSACDQCDISSAKFYYPEGLRFITPEVLLVADRYNHQLRMINLTSRLVTAIGTGRGYQDGPYQDSRLYYPQSIAVDKSSIYIGESTGLSGGVRKLAYTGMCKYS